MSTPFLLIDAQEREAIKAELRAELWVEFQDLLGAYVGNNEKWLRTDEALEKAQVCRATLVMSARADAPDTEQPGRITYRKAGTTCWYKQSSCISYARAKKGRRILAAA